MGRHIVLGLLGRGTFGATYVAYDPELERKVALKVFDARLSGAELRSRLVREARAVGRLSHVNIVAIYDVGMADDCAFISMEFIEGTGLDRILERGPLSVRDALVLTRAVGSALAAAHSEGVIHRDVKPSNVLIPRVRGEAVDFSAARLTDFGLARRLDRDDETGGAREISGTPAYMAPEQLRGRPEGPSTDVFGMGMLFLTAVLGRPPTQQPQVSSSLAAIADPSMVLSETKALPPLVKAFLAKAIASDPRARFSDARVAVEALATVAKKMRIDTPPPPVRRLPRWRSLTIGVVLGVATSIVFRPSGQLLASLLRSHSTVFHLALWIVGAAIAGLLSAFAVFKVIGRRETDLDQQLRVLLGRAGGLASLSDSVAIELDALFEACKKIDERLLVRSFAVMIDEYDRAKKSGDRQAALMNVVAILDRLTVRMSPWYVRNDKLVAILAGALTATATVVVALLKQR